MLSKKSFFDKPLAERVSNGWPRGFPIRGAFLDLDRFFEDFTNPLETSKSMASRVRETEEAYLLSVDLPGVRSEDLQLEVKDGYLKIEAHRKDLQEEEGGKSQYQAHFVRQWSLPDGIDQERLEAHLEHGVLHVALPKSEPKKAKKIDVKNSGSSFFKKVFSD